MIGPRRDDLRAAQVAAMVRNVNRGPKDKELTVEDLALAWELPVPEET